MKMEFDASSCSCQVRKLRSRSCERVLRKCRGLGRAVHGKVNTNTNTNTNTNANANTNTNTNTNTNSNANLLANADEIKDMNTITSKQFHPCQDTPIKMQ